MSRVSRASLGGWAYWVSQKTRCCVCSRARTNSYFLERNYMLAVELVMVPGRRVEVATRNTCKSIRTALANGLALGCPSPWNVPAAAAYVSRHMLLQSCSMSFAPVSRILLVNVYIAGAGTPNQCVARVSLDYNPDLDRLESCDEPLRCIFAYSQSIADKKHVCRIDTCGRHVHSTVAWPFHCDMAISL